MAIRYTFMVVGGFQEELICKLFLNSIWIFSSASMVLCSSLMRVITAIIDKQVGIFDVKSFACTNRYHSFKFNTIVCLDGKLLVVLGYNPEYLFVDAQSRKVLMFDDLSIEDLV
ncbi:hypothetical protein R3W88_014686 [Solanum pinnatisectum]|uniref:Uncharacterized protein n=1 Tax=Solanum pinnatisectum TaxID=50273 RepID=A0AAV9KSQ4_9SOLN|nr:hypothetical protein R3W88_014686 [Solanum pinnatisectum]